MKINALTPKEFPQPPKSLSRLIGPSFIILGLGLGSGELILWPYLSSNFGLGIIWAAIIGITFQFFINMEIERYTLATGESIFVGLARKFGKFAPYWFMATTLVPWMWPGIAASSAKVLSAAAGMEYNPNVGIAILILIGILLSLGKRIYKTQETIQKFIILLGVPSIFMLTLYFAQRSHWQALLDGIVGLGDGYFLLPGNLPMAIFLAALAYAGAGGNLNLAQSLYVKEKGYGMGKYSGHISSFFETNKEKIKVEGNSFRQTEKNIRRFKDWWKLINLEHALVFWLTGVITMLMLSLLAFSTVYSNPGIGTSINFVINEAKEISARTVPFVGTMFLSIVGVMLFGTQFSVYGSNARIAAENLVILNQDKFKPSSLHKFFYGFLWIQLLIGALIFKFGFTEPLALVVIGAVMNAFSMFIYSGMVLFLNMTILSKALRPSMFRVVAVFGAFLFYGAFSLFTLVRFLNG
jgi:hypothetical protein